MAGPPDREQALTGFLEHYAAGRWFDAHEVLEGAWRRSDDPGMRFLQGLIQWAVALEHHRRGNAHGARALLDRAIVNLQAGPPGSMGLDLSACRAAAPRMRRALAAWEAGAGRPQLSAPPIVRATGGASRT